MTVTTNLNLKDTVFLSKLVPFHELYSNHAACPRSRQSFNTSLTIGVICDKVVADHLRNDVKRGRFRVNLDSQRSETPERALFSSQAYCSESSTCKNVDEG